LARGMASTSILTCPSSLLTELLVRMVASTRRAGVTEEVPLFPLNTVLFPGMPLPLHIFEPRYREMIGLCSDEDRPFGVVLIKEGLEVDYRRRRLRSARWRRSSELIACRTAA